MKVVKMILISSFASSYMARMLDHYRVMTSCNFLILRQLKI